MFFSTNESFAFNLYTYACGGMLSKEYFISNPFVLKKMVVMTKEEHIQYWLQGAEHDLETAESMF